MAESELDPAVIQSTAKTLGKYVKKPALSEKLLRKPPFRFLFDVFKAVIKGTGYFDGLYNSDELNFENIKDREGKMRFLQKMIDVVKLITQRDLSVRTSKIVAGHEPERTNELLQLMGEIIEKQMSWQDAVKTVANGTMKGIDDGKTVAVKKKTEKADIKVKEKTKEDTKGNSVKENKNSKNVTPSPDEKTKKTTKVLSKSKENALNRQTTVEKVSKESKTKEKVTKKAKGATDTAKIAKNPSKADSKISTPSPIVPIQNDVTPLHVSLEPELSNGESKKMDETPNISKENSNNEKHVKEKRRNSKQNDELLSKTVINSTNGISNGNEIDTKASAGSQKSKSPNNERKPNSSDKNRGPSAIKPPTPTELGNAMPQDAEPLKSLKSVVEIPLSDAKVQASSAAATELNSQPQPIRKQVIREPTFTHENSRESIGSSSNSSTTLPRTSLRPPSARPPSARPGAPRRRDKNVEIILQPNEQVKISNIHVKLESFGDLYDDGENLVIIEDAASAVNLEEERNRNEKDIVQPEQQGHLVQQILETQKELTQQNSVMELKGDKDNSESVFDVNARQSSARQMNNLRDIIQNLTKSVNPFGKLMDFIPEDVDAMQLDLNMWRDAYSQAATDLKREKSLTESATEPLKNQLISIEANIKEYAEMIAGSRIKILQNSDKILKILLEQ